MTELESAAKKTKITFKVALLQRGMTQVELSKLLHTTPAQVSRALAGNTTPKDIEIQKAAAEILGIELSREDRK